MVELDEVQKLKHSIKMDETKELEHTREHTTTLTPLNPAKGKGKMEAEFGF